MKKLTVIKLGGSALDNLDPMLDFVDLKLKTSKVIVVHGGGPQISEKLNKLGHIPKFVEGLRVTDEATLVAATQVLAGSLNKKLVSALQTRGHKSTGMSGVDGQTVLAQLKGGGAWGFVGAELTVQPELLACLLQGGFTPVVAPLGVNSEGQILNINADTTAAAIAVALGAQDLLFLTDVDGVMNASGEVLPALDSKELATLQNEGAVSAGMLPKLEAALSAASGGVSGVYITSTNSKSGTLIRSAA